MPARLFQAFATLLIALSLCCDSFGQSRPPFGWAATAKGDGSFGRRIARTPAGETIVAGRFLFSTAVFGVVTLTNAVSAPYGSDDLYVVKYRADGGVEWAVRAGGDSSDVCSGLTVDSAGNCLVVGTFRNTAQFGSSNVTALANFGYGSGFVTKIDPNGNFLWTRRSGGHQDTAVATDSEGNYYTAGNMFPPADFGSVTLTNGSAFIAKYSPSGDLLTVTSFGDFVEVWGLSVDSANNCYVTGSFSRTAVFGSHTLTNRPGADQRSAFVARYNAVGTFEWARQTISEPHREDAYEHAWGLSIREHEGSVYLGGYFVSAVQIFDSVRLTNRSATLEEFDVFIAKYTSAGGLLWATSFGSDDTDDWGDLAVDARGDVLFTATLNAPFHFGATSLTNSSGGDVYVAKLSANGAPVWARQPGGVHFARAHGIALRPNGDVVCAGEYRGRMDFGTTSITNSKINFDMFAFKLLADPELQLERIGSGFVLRWPSNKPGFVLEQTTTFPATNWFLVTNTPVINSGFYAVTNPAAGPMDYFRLRK